MCVSDRQDSLSIYVCTQRIEQSEVWYHDVELVLLKLSNECTLHDKNTLNIKQMRAITNHSCLITIEKVKLISPTDHQTDLFTWPFTSQVLKCSFSVVIILQRALIVQRDDSNLFGFLLKRCASTIMSWTKSLEAKHQLWSTIKTGHLKCQAMLLLKSIPPPEWWSDWTVHTNFATVDLILIMCYFSRFYFWKDPS